MILLRSFVLICATVIAARADTLTSRGTALLAEGRIKEAVALLDKALKADPKNAAARANRATARYKLGDWDGAISDFEASTLPAKVKRTLSVSISDAHYRRALFLIDKGSAAAAAQDLYAAVKLDRKNALAYCELGTLAVNQGQADTAIGYLDRALSLDKDRPEAYASRAAARFALGRGAQALEDIDRAIFLQPQTALFFASRARIGESLGNRAQSLKDARRAVELDPALDHPLASILNKR
ncbi:MAG: tetratricopeptide repeat protein [Elusimicrobiota bacterium]